MRGGWACLTLMAAGGKIAVALMLLGRDDVDVKVWVSEGPCH